MIYYQNVMQELLVNPKNIDNILSKISKSESNIKKVLLVDKTGLTIASISKFSYFLTDIDAIGAISSAVFIATEEQGKSLELDDLEVFTCEFSGGKIFTSGCGSEAVLAIISGPDVNIGLIRLLLKRSISELKEILAGFYLDYDDPVNYRDPRDPGDGSEGALANF